MNTLLKVLGWVSIIGGIILGIIAGNAVNDLAAEIMGSLYEKSFSWSAALGWWIGGFVSGVVLLAIGQALDKLDYLQSQLKSAD